MSIISGNVEPLISSLKQKKAALLGCQFFAEGTRFELVVQNNPYGSLANCWFQPLTHPSGNDVPETPATQAGLQRYIILLTSQEEHAKM